MKENVDLKSIGAKVIAVEKTKNEGLFLEVQGNGYATKINET